MSLRLGVFNANNLFMRYKFARSFAGDVSGKSTTTNPQWGFLPVYTRGTFEPYRPEQTALCAAALKGKDGLPDVVALCEIESLLALRVFNIDDLKEYYPYAVLIDSYDFRQIDVAILSRKEILSVRSHVDDTLPNSSERVFSRDCLEVTLALNASGTRTFTLFLNHLKSKFVNRRGKSPQKIAAEERKNDEKRAAQSLAVRRIVRERFPGPEFGKGWFAVVGDFNAGPMEPSVAALVRQSGLHNVIADLPPAEQWTYWWKAENEASQIDYMLLSPALADRVATAGTVPYIERGGLGFSRTLTDGSPGPAKTTITHGPADTTNVEVPFSYKRFKGVTEKLAASDHCPVVLELPI